MSSADQDPPDDQLTRDLLARHAAREEVQRRAIDALLRRPATAKLTAADLRPPDGYPVKGVFEVHLWPNAHPDEVSLRRGFADCGLGGWYVVIDNGSRVDAHGQWTHQWGYGVSWFHPDPNYQIPVHGTFDQTLVPVDDVAKHIMRFVKEQHPS